MCELTLFCFEMPLFCQRIRYYFHGSRFKILKTEM
jgi:hypothetical protein